MNHKGLGYIVAIVTTIFVTLFRLALNEELAEQARLLPFVLAVIAAAWWGGLGPGLLATLLGVVLGVLFIVPPPFSFVIENLEDGLNALIFVLVGVTISFLCEALHDARRRETEKQFRTLADSIPQLAWMARPNGCRFWFNRRWCDYTGIAADQAEKGDWHLVYAPKDRDRVIANWDAAIQTGEPWEETVPLRRHDGAMRWHLCRALPLRDEYGEIVRWFGTSTDITEHIEFEQALKDSDRRKDEFLATLAHELRNPLAPLSNALQLWTFSEGDKAEMDQLRGLMERQVRQLVRLIDDLMDLSRIASGKIHLRQQPLDLSAALSQAIEATQPLIHSRGHQLQVTSSIAPVFVQGDLTRLTQVFANILTNAAKYTPRNGTIWLTTEQQDDNIVISIRDNGPGIPANMLTEVFEMFRQADRSLTRSQGGLGIGLTLVKQLVKLHDGSVEARSAGLGEGSEFIVTLPALIGDHPISQEKHGRDRSSPAIANLPRHRILVVDDVADSAQTLAMVLQSIGQDATSILEGSAAIEWILTHHPDVVFLDIAMPGLDGYELARRLREYPELANTVLVALTGYGQPEDRRRAFEAGFNFHLTKPTNIAALEDLLFKLPVGIAMIETATS